MSAVITGQYSLPKLPMIYGMQIEPMLGGEGWVQGRCEWTYGHINTSDTPISLNMYAVSLEGETKIILTLASHPRRDVTGKITSTSILTEISDIPALLTMSSIFQFQTHVLPTLWNCWLI